MVLSKHSTCSSSESRKVFSRERTVDMTEAIDCSAAVRAEPENHLALCSSGSPFVVLDEPTNGLDPNQIVEIRNLIKEIAEDHSVLLSTHILSEVQATCNDIRMIEHGKVVFSGSMKDFDNYVVPSSFTVTFALPPSIEELAKIEHVLNIEELYPGTFRIRFDDDKT